MTRRRRDVPSIYCRHVASRRRETHRRGCISPSPAFHKHNRRDSLSRDDLNPESVSLRSARRGLYIHYILFIGTTQ